MSILEAAQRLIAPLVEPRVFDFWAQHINPMWSWGRSLAKVVQRQQESIDAVTLTLQPNRNFRGFMPGQHVNVSVRVDGVVVTRSYSFTGIPTEDGCISLTIKQAVGGRLSQHLCHAIQIGDVVELSQAFGVMTLPELTQQAPHKWLFLVAGSGITPIMSLLRSLMAGEIKHNIVLIYWAKRHAEFCFAAELKALMKKKPKRLTVYFIASLELTECDDYVLSAVARNRTPRLDSDLLWLILPDMARRRVYSCGTIDFVAAAKEASLAFAETFHGEAFTAPRAVTGIDGAVQVTLSRSGRTVEVPAGEPLLGALEAHGLTPPYGCRIGICNTCVCEKTTGVTQNIYAGRPEDGLVSALRLCVNRACTDITLSI